MKRAMDRALELLNTGDLTNCIEEGRPNWIQLTIWERLIHHRLATNKLKELSKKNKKNRLTRTII